MESKRLCEPRARFTATQKLESDGVWVTVRDHQNHVAYAVQVEPEVSGEDREHWDAEVLHHLETEDEPSTAWWFVRDVLGDFY